MSLVLRTVLAASFRLSRESKKRFRWLFVNPLCHLLLQRAGHPIVEWQWRHAQPSAPLRYAMRYPLQLTVEILRWLCSFVARDAKSRRAAAQRLNIVLVYSTWGILVWFVVAFGIDMFTLSGQLAQQSYIDSWVVSAFLTQCMQLEIVARVFSMTLLLNLRKAFWLLPHQVWLEGHLDVLSVADTVPPHASLREYVATHVISHASVGIA